MLSHKRSNSIITTANARRRFLLQSLAGLAAASALPAGAATDSGLRALLLGTQGGPNFNLLRGESASVLLIDKRLYMVDCGYGALAALVRANLNYRDVGQVFLTHLHDDHVADVVSLMGHQWTGGRVAPTVIHGPAGTRRLVAAAIAYNQVNEQVRRVDEARSARVASLFKAHEVTATAQPQVVYRDADLTVLAIENTHYPPEAKQRMPQRSLSLRFEARGRSIVFSGDTA